MPENNSPAAKSQPEAAPGEFDFTQAPAENPRLKRRSLKGASLKPAGGPPPGARELAREAPPLSAGEAKPVIAPQPRDDDDAESHAAVKFTEPETTSAASITAPSQPVSRSTPAQPTSTASPATSPHGTRPATLYYSTGVRKDKEAPSPMKTTPIANPAPSPSPTTLPSSPARSAASAVRPVSMIDYRTNADRQAREQKSVGGVLSLLVYALIAFFVIGATLAGYGAYVVSVQLHQQSVTVSDLDARYAAANKDLNVRLATTLDTLTLAQAQINRQQELILEQQKTINSLLSSTAVNASGLRREQQTRAQETANLRSRLKDLEYKGPTAQKY